MKYAVNIAIWLTLVGTIAVAMEHKPVKKRQGAFVYQSKEIKRRRLALVKFTVQTCTTFIDLPDQMLTQIAQLLSDSDNASVRKTCSRMRYSFWDPLRTIQVIDPGVKYQWYDRNYWDVILANVLLVRKFIGLCGGDNKLNLYIFGVNFRENASMPIVFAMACLQRLTITDTNLSGDNLHTIALMTSLEELRLHNIKGSEVNKFSFLNKLTRLHYLNLSFNNLTELPQLTQLSNLRTLRVRANELNDIESVYSLTKLEKLDLSYNQLRGISPLISALCSLKFLNLNGLMLSEADERNMTAWLPRTKILY